ncbi:transglycosylase domain-containing protein [candidate division KSB1 bacterium]
MIKYIKYCVITICLLLVLFIVYLGYETMNLPMLPDDLNDLDLSEPSVIYAQDGRPLYQMRTRQVVPIDRISPNFKNAILAVEDHRFYDHKGIEKLGVVKAFVLNTLLRQRSPGRSTITQQLAKNLFLTFDRSVRRKIKDILLAMQFERRYSKEDILQAYCNQINFGNGAFGVENAALSYFGKHASELNLTESTLLAAIPQSPTYYNLYIDTERVKSRYMFILRKMRDLEWISKSDYDEAVEYNFALKNFISRSSIAPHFIEMIKLHISRNYDEDLLNYGGLKIYTTIDLEMQEKAVEAVQEKLRELDTRLGKEDYRLSKRDEKSSYPEGSLIALEPSSGAIRALVGGRDSQGDYYNRPFDAKRSPGSSFKPSLYLTSIIDLGINGATVMVDSQVTYPDNDGTWTPRNFDPEFFGPIVLKQALRKSINTVAAQLIHQVTPDRVVEMAGKLGIKTDLLPVYSLALGSNGVPAVEHAAMYGTLANMGETCTPYFIERIEYANGKVLEQKEITIRERIVEQEKVYLLLDMMKGVLEPGGTGSSVRSRYSFMLPACGKTGTTNDHRDAWFAGMTPDLAAVAWVGYDDFSPIRDQRRIGITGSTGGLPIWASFMKKIEHRLSESDFPIPPGIDFVHVDINTGEEVSDFAPNSIRVAVLR